MGEGGVTGASGEDTVEEVTGEPVSLLAVLTCMARQQKPNLSTALAVNG
jgi:hypothetical protein